MNFNKISFYTFGCRLNQAETAILQQRFEDHGYQVVPFKEESEVVVVNTCTVTENGDADTRKLVNKVNRLQPHAQIALIGCQAQIQREKLLTLPNVQWVIGNARKMALPHILRRSHENSAPLVIAPVISRKSFKLNTPGIDRQHTRANLKVQDGCDFFCAFCVIPYARGRARSRDFKNLLDEARTLVKNGHREIVLTGINVGTYQNGDKTITDVIRHLQDIDGLQRIRISSIEPTTIPDNLIDIMSCDNKLCRYLHIPLQSGNDNILHKMNRKYRVREYSDFIHHLQSKIPGICIGTDVIVGFPGEDEHAFQDTFNLLKELPLAYFHVFSYSERPWAKSRKLSPKVPEGDVKRRSELLRQLSNQKRAEYLEPLIGSEQEVLFEQRKNDFWKGLTDTYVRVKVRSNSDLRNKYLPVQLTEIHRNNMIGHLLSSREHPIQASTAR